MAKYILVYKIHDYPENEGGMHAEDFEPSEERKMHDRVNELAKLHKEIFEIIYAGYMTTMFKYEPVKYAVEYIEKRI